MAAQAHPDLQGGKKPLLQHRFSPRQMRVLAAICDTFVPSLPIEASAQESSTKSKLFELSASESGIVPEVAGMLCAWTTRSQYWLIHAALLLLSTTLGTILLSGFPDFRPFDRLSLDKRERIVLVWSRSSFRKLQMFFKVCKCYTLFKFYSRADERGRNPAWDAIGYTVPVPDRREDPAPSPLDARVVDAKSPDFRETLAALGCSMLHSVDHLRDPSSGGSSSSDFGIKCDVAVVGSGSGGSVIAARLAQRGFSVVVLEKGAYYPRHRLSLLEGPSMNAMYEQSGALTTEDGSVVFLAGTTLGGGSSVNWAASIPTPDHVLAEWSALGLDRFADAEHRDAMRAVCDRLGVTDACTGESFQNRVLRAGCTAMGYSVGHVPRNAAAGHACGFCSFGCPAPRPQGKQSAVDTWLRDAAAARAVIITKCTVDRVVTTAAGRGGRRRRARGICSRLDDGWLFVESRVTVAACGALFTPPLLRRSGLRNPHIGRHLSIHPVVAAWGYFPREKIPPGNSYTGGIMTTFSSVAARWDATGYGSMLETPSLHPGTFAVMAPWRSGLDSKRRMVLYPRTATIIVINRDRGEGTVDDRKGGKPVLEYSLFVPDRESLVEGAEKALRVLAAAGAEVVGLNCLGGEIAHSNSPSSLAGDDEFERFLSSAARKMFQGLSTPIFSAHQMGSCRMGVDPRGSAVDPDCQSWEVEGLFVGDGSVLPTASGVNPMITIQAIAHSTAARIASFLDGET